MMVKRVMYEGCTYCHHAVTKTEQGSCYHVNVLHDDFVLTTKCMVARCGCMMPHQLDVGDTEKKKKKKKE